jgi:hypothetical protein
MADRYELPTGTKELTILSAMRSGQSLNRFDAERLGDHVLPSTIAILRAKGHLILGSWEKVPTRFGRMVRVRRYAYVGMI